MVYETLYDEVCQALARDGRWMPVTREAFLLAAEMPVGTFDVALLEHADNRTFLEVAFLCIRFTVPGEGGMRDWDKYVESLEPVQFRRKLLRVIVNRCAARKQRLFVINAEEYLDA